MVGKEDVPIPLCPLATPQPDGLPVFLQLSDQLITLSDDVLVLLVLVVGSVGLNDALACHAVDGAGDTAGSNEPGEIAKRT